FLSQLVRDTVRDPANVDEDAFVGEVGQQAAAVGDADGRVQGDGLPDPVDVGFGDPMFPQDASSEIGTFDLEATFSLRVLTETEVVHDRRGEEQILVVGRVARTALFVGDQASEQKASNAVVHD